MELRIQHQEMQLIKDHISMQESDPEMPLTNAHHAMKESAFDLAGGVTFTLHQEVIASISNLTKENAEHNFYMIANECFESAGMMTYMSWKKICRVFVFAGHFARKCREEGLGHEMDGVVVDMLTAFINEKAIAWIASRQGDWDDIESEAAALWTSDIV